MEGRGFSGLYKNSSEELLLKTVMESPIGMQVPTMEMLGFKTVSQQSFRTDSEELFKRWLTNGEASLYMTHDHVILLFFVVSVLACVINDQRRKISYIFSFQVSERIPTLYISDLCVYLSIYNIPVDYDQEH